MKRLYWIVPPLLALAGYFSTGALLPEEGGRETVAAKSRKEPRQARPRYTIEQAREQLAADLRADAAPGPEHLQALDIAQLRQRVLDQFGRYRALEDKLKGSGSANEDDIFDFEFCREQMEQATAELVRREKEQACEWIEKEAPDLRLVAIDAWATHEPDAAWAAILRSERIPPCDINTIYRMLMLKESDPTTLREACAQVPWDRLTLYHPPGTELRGGGKGLMHMVTPFQPELRMLNNWRPWVESGAALELAQRGVSVGGMHRLWSQTEPLAAIKAWQEWPDLGSGSASLTELLPSPHMAELLPSQDRVPIADVVAVLKELTPPQRARARRDFENYAKQYPHSVNVMKPYFDALGIPIPADKE